MIKPVSIVGNFTSDCHLSLTNSLGELSHYHGKVEVEDGSMTLGGAGFNMAHGLDKLAVPVELATFASAEVVELLHRSGPRIGTRFLKHTPSPAFSVVLNSHSDQIILIKRAHIKLRDLPWKEIYAESSKLMLGPQFKANNQEVAAILASAPPGLVYWLPGSTQLPELQTFLKDAHLCAVQMNETEALLATSAKSIEEAIVRLRHWACEDTISIITTSTCALAWADGHYYKVPAYRVRIKDTTGCGDGFAAAMLATLLQGKSIDEALLNGHRNGASVAKYIGATAGHLDWEGLKTFEPGAEPSQPETCEPAPAKAGVALPSHARAFAWAMITTAVFLFVAVALLLR